MHYRIFLALTKGETSSISTKSLTHLSSTLRTQLLTGVGPVVFLNTLFNLVDRALAARAQEFVCDYELILECDLCHTVRTESQGEWIDGQFVCGGCATVPRALSWTEAWV